MNAKFIPDKTNNYNVYVGTASKANRIVGVTDEIGLINLQNLSETLNLAGSAGEFDSPTVGQYKSIEIEIPFTNISKRMMQVAANDATPLIFRSAQEFINPETLAKEMVNRTTTVRGMTKAINFGKLKKSGYGNPSITKEVAYYKEVVDGEIVTEIDKLNGKVVIDGVEITKAISDYI